MDIKDYPDTPPWDWPRNARQQFLKLLKDRKAKPQDRLIAAEMAGNTVAIDDELAAALLTVVSNPAETEEMRCNAVIAFGPALELGDTMEFDDPDDVPISEEMFHRLQEALEKLYRDTSTPKQVRRRILEAAVRAPLDWQEEALLAAYASGDREWVLTAVFAMRYVRGDFDRQILESLKSKDPEIYREAVYAAGSSQVEAAWPEIVRLIENPRTPKVLMLAAIDAVSEIKPAEAEEVLAPLLNSKDEDISEAASEAIAMAKGMAEMEDFDFDEDDEEEEEEEEKGGGWIN